MDDLEQRISASFRSQGLMTMLGAELVHVATGEVHIALSPRPQVCQQDGNIHAGALTSVLDSACGYAAMTVAQPGCDVLTLEFKVKFIRPAAGTDRFVAIGKVRQQVDTSLTMCHGKIVSEQGAQQETVALMEATISNVPGNA